MRDKKFWLYLILGMLLFSIWETWQREHPKVEGNISADQATSANILEKQGEENLVKKFGDTPKMVDKFDRVIEIDTDVLKLVIDLHGGGVVESVLKSYPVELGKGQSVRLLSKENNEEYLARSGILSVKTVNQKATYEIIEFFTEHSSYRMDGDVLEVVLKGKNSEGVIFSRVLTFRKGHYDFVIKDQVKNETPQLWQGKFYAEIERKAPKVSKGFFGLNTYTGAAISSEQKPYEKVPFTQLEKYNKQGGKIREAQGGWLAMQQRYFLNVWIPEQNGSYQYFGTVENQKYTIGLYGNLFSLSPGENYESSITLYTGPELVKNLAGLAKGLDRTVDYGWLWIISSGFFKLLTWCQFLVRNWGLAIIFITFLIKLAFFKLSESSCRSMAKMKDLVPKMNDLKEKYGEDKAKLQQAMMTLYKEEKINPLNFGGCLPMLIQIPFFIALYYVLISAVELRHAPFFGWIKDLSAQDPYYILPVIMGLTMFIQQKLSPSPTDSTQAKMMLVMPFFFTFLFIKFPAGLVLYWVINNLLSIAQQWYINGKIDKEKRLAMEKKIRQR